MEYEEDLGKLEKNVEKLLNSLDSVQDDRLKIKADLELLSQEKKALEEEVGRLKEEKRQILQRVTGLIGSIEKWQRAAGEMAMDGKADIVDDAKAVQVDPVQGMLVGN
ncbi:MAG: DUF904 domain-containing protein [Desulfobulbaceae bacterium]|nr:DUF904 domain-containing protein [Desulfobulbaceae bacterium]